MFFEFTKKESKKKMLVAVPHIQSIHELEDGIRVTVEDESFVCAEKYSDFLMQLKLQSMQQQNQQTFRG